MKVSTLKVRFTIKRMWLAKAAAHLHFVMCGDADRAAEFGMKFAKIEVFK